jgi:hypothetical protein
MTETQIANKVKIIFSRKAILACLQYCKVKKTFVGNGLISTTGRHKIRSWESSQMKKVSVSNDTLAFPQNGNSE